MFELVTIIYFGLFILVYLFTTPFLKNGFTVCCWVATADHQHRTSTAAVHNERDCCANTESQTVDCSHCVLVFVPCCQGVLVVTGEWPVAAPFSAQSETCVWRRGNHCCLQRADSAEWYHSQHSTGTSTAVPLQPNSHWSWYCSDCCGLVRNQSMLTSNPRQSVALVQRVGTVYGTVGTTPSFSFWYFTGTTAGIVNWIFFN